MSHKRITTDHEEIRHWVEEHDGVPAAVHGSSGKSDERGLRILFPDQSISEPVEEISWSDFFDKFEEEDLAFMYRDDGESRFFRIVER